MTEIECQLEPLLNLVKKRIIRKANMYDGFNSVGTSGLNSVSRFLFSVVEEIGEVSSAITRNRYGLAKEECIDVAHSALLLYKALERFENDENL